MIASTPVQCGIMSGLAIEKLKTLSEALAELTKDDINISRSLKDSANRLSKLELSLVLLGQFKRGKSILPSLTSLLPSNMVKKKILDELKKTKKEIEIGLKKGKDLSDKTLEEKINMKKLLDKQISIVSEIIKKTE